MTPLVGGEMHDARDRRPGPGNHARPLRCTDKACPSRSKCRRPEFEGKDGEFHRNREGKEWCAYIVHKEDGDG